MNKFDIIEENEFGRKRTIRYKQYLYGPVGGIDAWRIDRHGCGPTTLASILASLGFDLDPVDIARYLLLDESGNPLDFFNDREKGLLGTRDIGYLYVLNRLLKERRCDLEYALVKLSYMHPEIKKSQIVEMIKNEYMAIICVGPHDGHYPATFSNGGHYIALSGVNSTNGEFYVINPNKIGDSQIDMTFPYELIVKNMYSNCFDFLMIKRDEKKSLRL